MRLLEAYRRNAKTGQLDGLENQGRFNMRNMMQLNFAACLAALAALVPVTGHHGLWTAQAVSFIVRAITLVWKYPALARDTERRA